MRRFVMDVWTLVDPAGEVVCEVGLPLIYLTEKEAHRASDSVRMVRRAELVLRRRKP